MALSLDVICHATSLLLWGLLFSSESFFIPYRRRRIGDGRRVVGPWIGKAAAMAGHEVARCNLGILEQNLEIWMELLSIGQLRNLLGIIMPCITC